MKAFQILLTAGILGATLSLSQTGRTQTPAQTQQPTQEQSPEQIQGQTKGQTKG